MEGLIGSQDIGFLFSDNMYVDEDSLLGNDFAIMFLAVPSNKSINSEYMSASDEVQMPTSKRPRRQVRPHKKSQNSTTVSSKQPVGGAGLQYASSLFKAYNNAEFEELRVIFDTILTPACEMRIQALNIGSPIFANKLIPREKIHDYFAAWSESIPDGIATVLSTKVKTTGDFKTAVTTFEFSGTQINNSAAVFRERFVIAEQSVLQMQLLASRPNSFSLRLRGNVVLTLDTDSKVTAIDILYYSIGNTQASLN